MDLNSNKPYTFDRVVRLVIGIALGLAFFYLLGILSDVLIPFAIAMVIAYLINPLTDWIQKWVKIRIVAVIITLIIFLGTIFLAGRLIVPLIIKEFTHMWQLLSELVNNAQMANRAEERMPRSLWEYFEEFIAREDVKKVFGSEDFKSIINVVAQKVLPGIWGVISSATSILLGSLGLLLVILYLLFILKDYAVLKEGWKELLPAKYKAQILDFYAEFKRILNRYFRGQAMIASTVGILFALGFWIVGLPMGIALGLFMGVLNMVPYLQTIGFIPITLAAGLYALEYETSFFYMFGLAFLVIAIVQAFQETILIPRIMGKVTGFNPAMILLSLSIWGKLLGLFGLIIALPLTYLLLTYYRRFLHKTKLQMHHDNLQKENP